VRIAGLSLLLYLVVANARYGLHVLPNLWEPADRGLPTDLNNYLYNTYRLWPMDFLVYCGFFAVSFSLDYHFKYRRRADEAMRLEVKTAQLESDLARAELAALRGQLHPHFLFNCFNAIATLVRQRKNDEAVETVAQLSALLRLAIERTSFHEVPLEQEIDFIRRYLDLERVRFGEKLRVDLAVEPTALAVLVPNIILQPLVENAIKHGISLRTTPGTVRLAVNRQQERLHLEIANDGADLAPPADRHSTGIGLANTRSRLTKLYGDDYRLDFIRQPAGGMLVTLDLPWRLANQSAPVP
jgi:LytS/YehU family sensor histidine kinase